MGNNAEMDKRNNQMTNSRNVFCRFFRTMVMVHKIPHARLTEWNNKRKHKALASGIYLLSIRVCATGVRLAEGSLLRRFGAGRAADAHPLGIQRRQEDMQGSPARTARASPLLETGGGGLLGSNCGGGGGGECGVFLLPCINK